MVEVGAIGRSCVKARMRPLVVVEVQVPADRNARLGDAVSRALALLQKVACNDLDRPIGTIVYTQLCNERGGIGYLGAC